MSTHGNIVVLFRTYPMTEEPKPLYLYQHRDAEALPRTLARALDRGRDRWGDAAYLARIIFCEMVRGAGDAVRDFGISPLFTDASIPDIEVDPDTHTVHCGRKKWTFEQYVTQFALKEQLHA